MLYPKFFLLTAAALIAAGSTAFTQQPGCDTTAQAMLESAEEDAEGEFWEAIAVIANQPSNHAALFQQAVEAREEALELADAQFAARMALCSLLGNGIYQPALSPSEFSPNVTNTYFPLIIGRKLIYESIIGTDVERVEVVTEAGTQDINGYDCRIVRDTVTLNGVFLEDTHDWYAQRNDGNVWYMGEIAVNYDESGMIEDVDGSWRYGRDNALPGIVMLASPMIGDIYRQEYLIDEAEDVARVIATGVTVSVPAGTFTNCIVTQDGSPLEPDANEHKYYAPGVGLVLELKPATGEMLELIAIM
jgi:hypothetical protein